MYKKLIWIVALTFSLVIGQTAFANCGESMRTMVESLKLDDAQKEKIKPIMDQLKATMKDAVPQMMEVSKQIRQQTMSATMDQGTIDSLVDKKTKMIGDMMKAKIAAKNQIFAVLNDKQKAQLQSMMKTVEEKMEAKYKNCHNNDE